MESKFNIGDKVKINGLTSYDIYEVTTILSPHKYCITDNKGRPFHVTENEIELTTNIMLEKIPNIDNKVEYNELNELKEENEELRELLDIAKATIQMISELI